MYKSTARSSAYLARTGNYATHGSRGGFVSIVPKEPQLNWDPVAYERLFLMVQIAVDHQRENGGTTFREGAIAAAAMAGLQFPADPQRARDAMIAVLDGMRIPSA